MKLDFLHSGGAAPGGKGGFTLFEAPKPKRLDDASRVIRVGLIAAGFFFGILLLFAALAPISGAAVASGEVTTSGGRVVIQPATGGVVTRLLVREGQAVRAGQPLAELNGVRPGAALEQAQARRDGLRALQARLIAQRDDLDRIAFPADLAERSTTPAVASALAAQSAIFARHREIRRAEQGMAAAETDAASAQRTGAARQLALINDELRVMRELFAKGYARRTQVRALERAAADLQAQIASGSAGVARAQLEQARLGQTQITDVVTELGQVEAQLAQVDPALRVSRYDASLSRLASPVDGRVSGVAAIGPGSVVGGGTSLMEIVPDHRALVIEARIRPEDIDDVAVGQTAMLRFTTVNPRGQSSVEGRVVTLSPARLRDQAGDSFLAQITVADTGQLQASGIDLQPGLPVTVNVETQSRTLLDYLLAPLADGFSGAFREE